MSFNQRSVKCWRCSKSANCTAQREDLRLQNGSVLEKNPNTDAVLSGFHFSVSFNDVAVRLESHILQSVSGWQGWRCRAEDNSWYHRGNFLVAINNPNSRDTVFPKSYLLLIHFQFVLIPWSKFFFLWRSYKKVNRKGFLLMFFMYFIM